MFPQFRKKFGRIALCGAVLLAAANWVNAQNLPGIPQQPAPVLAPAPAVAQPSQEDLRAVVLQQGKLIQELLEKERLRSQQPVGISPAVGADGAAAASQQPLPPPNLRQMVDDVLRDKAEAAKMAEAEQRKQGIVVGSDMNLSGSVNPGGQSIFQTRYKDFSIHFYGEAQLDFVLGTSADPNLENGKGGTGSFQEANNFRRLRLGVDGWMWENMDFMCVVDFANTPFNDGTGAALKTPAGTPTNTQPFGNIDNFPAPIDVWGAINYLPVIGTFRAGNIKPQIGLDHIESSRFLDFLERSIGFDTYYNRNNGYEPGMMIMNMSENELWTWSLSATRTSNTGFGFSQGSAWDYTGHISFLPFYENNGAHMLYVAVGGKWQGLDDSSGAGVANLNGRWGLRNGQSGLQNVVSFVNLTGQDQEIINPEIYFNWDRLSVQAEWLGSNVTGVTKWSSQLTPAAVTIPSRNFESQSAYVQAMWFLTGETRPFNKGVIHSSGAAPTRVVPIRNFYWMPGRGCSNPFSSGAWQVGARYEYQTLNSGNINGGQVNQVTLGLNWFLNPNMKFQWNYVAGYRDMGVAGGASGNYDGFGMRVAVDW